MISFTNLLRDCFRGIIFSAIPATTSKYDRQYCIILDSDDRVFAADLAFKGKLKGIQTTIIDLSDKRDFSALKGLTADSRIYIVGHCKKGQEYLSDEHGVKLYSTEIAHQICTNALLEDNKTPLRISVIACEAASTNGREASFCQHLSRSLAKLSIYAEVQGRTENVWTAYAVGKDGRATKKNGEPGQVQRKLRFTTQVDTPHQTKITELYQFKANSEGIPG